MLSFVGCDAILYNCSWSLYAGHYPSRPPAPAALATHPMGHRDWKCIFSKCYFKKAQMKEPRFEFRPLTLGKNKN